MKQNDILLILIPAFLLVVAWVIFSVYQNTVTSTIPENVSQTIRPIAPRFDTTTLNQLKTRTPVAPQYVPDVIQTAQQSSLQTPTATNAATQLQTQTIVISSSSAQPTGGLR